MNQFDNTVDTQVLEQDDLAEENARLDDIYPEYTGETIRIIDPVELKQAQFEIVQETNPMQDDYHVGIRSVNDIKTFAETINDEESFVWGDYSREDAQRDLAKNEITVYSSYPIENGVFVSTSYRQAQEYAGGKGKKVYERTVPLDFVAWINGDEGQFAMTDIIGKKRTVYNSNGDRIAKSEPALRNFWNWFGDSKVVDKDGRPLVVYHGSDVSGIEIFDNQANKTKQRQIGAEKGYFFTDSKKVAERFRTTEQRKAENKYYTENTIREPVTEEKYDAQGRYLGSVHYAKTTLPEYKNFGLYPVYLKADNVVEYNGEDIGVGEERAVALESARQSGKDGVVIYNADTGAGIANEYIVFDQYGGKFNQTVNALQEIVNGAEEATVKDLRNDLTQYGGTNDITFVWGNKKKGIVHIATDHSVDVLPKVIDTVIDGKITHFTKKNKTVHLMKNGIEAVLSLDEHGNTKTWLLTGWDTSISKDAEREFNATLGATQDGPTFSRSELGALLNTMSMTQPHKNVNSQIKSTQNRGTFSKDTGNIYHQRTQANGYYDAELKVIVLGRNMNTVPRPRVWQFNG